jgi:subtilisin family serine protease
MRRLLFGTALAAALLAAPAFAGAAPDPLRSQQWGLSQVHSDAAHVLTRGGGAVIAVVDTGVTASHPDLRGRVLSGFDFVERDATPQDEVGHGTHVTGIAAANEGNGIGIASVAPGAKVLPVKVLGEQGGEASTVAAGIDFAVRKGVDVINLSLGEDLPIFGSDAAFSAAIRRALDRGIVVVAASGNNGVPLCEQPTGDGRLLCVGSVDRRGSRSLFSSFGRGLDLVAPGGSGLPFEGEGVLSTWNDGGYQELDGTSMAAPHVSGVAALLASRGVRGQAAVSRILATAADAGARGRDPQYGAGIVNARRAVEGLPSSPRPAQLAPPPAATRPAAGPSRTPGRGRIAVKRVQRIRRVLRRGIRVRCRAAVTGRCRVRVVRLRRRRAFARGSRRVAAGERVVVRARPTRRGRRLLRRALRRHRRVRARVRVRLPGGALITRRITLRP